MIRPDDYEDTASSILLEELLSWTQVGGDLESPESHINKIKTELLRRFAVEDGKAYAVKVVPHCSNCDARLGQRATRCWRCGRFLDWSNITKEWMGEAFDSGVPSTKLEPGTSLVKTR